MMKLYKKAGNLNQIKAYVNCNTCVNHIDKCQRYCQMENGFWDEAYQNDWRLTLISFDTRGGK